MNLFPSAYQIAGKGGKDGSLHDCRRGSPHGALAERDGRRMSGAADIVGKASPVTTGRDEARWLAR